MRVLSPFWALGLTATATLARADGRLDFSSTSTKTFENSWQTLASSPPTESLPPRNTTVALDGADLAEPLALNGRSTPVQRNTAVLRPREDPIASLTKRTDFCERPCSGCINNNGSREETSLSRRVTGEIGKLSPADFDGDAEAFIMELQRRAVKVPHTYHASSVHHELMADQYALADSELGGCTSVVVVSEKGIYMAHFWEIPYFFTLEPKGKGPEVHGVPTQKETFMAEVIHPLIYGGPNMSSGLYPLTRDGELFGPDMNPRALIITPPWPGTGKPVHKAKVDQIMEHLQLWMPEAPAPIIKLYTALRGAQYDLKTTPKGKVVVQYDPFDHIKGKGDDPDDEDYGESEDEEGSDEGCSPEKIAKIRVWVEDQKEPEDKMSWWAWPEQNGPS